MNSPIEKLTELAHNYQCSHLCQEILDDYRFPLWTASGSPDKHHYGKGGLATHTLEVVELCLLNLSFFDSHPISRPKPTQVFLAAFFHDVGKMWDYEPQDEAQTIWVKTAHAREIHHICRSALVWNEIANRNGAEAWPSKDSITHAILAHHGRREWGSPVSPKTRLAWLLHLCDSISARMDDCDRIKENY